MNSVSSFQCSDFSRLALRAVAAANRTLPTAYCLLPTLLLLLAAASHAAPAARFPVHWPAADAKPHPAVARILVPMEGARSYGSGTLIAAGEQYGLVVTNWHVVRDAAGPIVVEFPDGFRSEATLLKVDADWDLAALAIWKPPIDPVSLADAPARPGDLLTIAGYGSGDYRQVTGPCTKYVAPGMNLPSEMVELRATARQGDSGGPILNERGQLAGVLFGEGQGRTVGSYSGRVRDFLASVTPAVINDLDASQTPATMAASRAPADEPPSPKQSDPRPDFVQLPTIERPPTPQPPPSPEARPLPPAADIDPWYAAAATPPSGDESDYPTDFDQLVGVTRFEQLKSFFAVIGAFAMLLLVVRAFGASK